MKAGWKTVKLGEACKIVNGATPSTSVEANWGGPHCWITPAEMGGLSDPYVSETRRTLTDVGLADCSASLLPEGSVILSSRAPIGHVIINTVPMATNQGCKSMIPRSDLDAKFLFYFIKANVPLLESLGTGATFKELSGGKLASVEISLPPLAEQKRIVALLDEAFAGIDEAKTKAEANIAAVESLLQSHLDQTFRTPKPGWISSKLGAVGKVSMCKRILKEQTKPIGEIPFYKIGTFGKQPDAYIPSSIYNEFRSKYPFPSKGDVLISAAGTIGRRVRYDGEPAYFQDSNIVWIENDEKKVLNNYLYHFYSACEWNSTSGATISRLYNDNLRSIDIVFPASLDEQQAVAAQTDRVISEVQELRKAYEQKESAFSLLKVSLLSQAFAGELTA